MKERPILFSSPMVSAILEGRKTMTRRIVKTQPDDECYYLCDTETRDGIFGMVIDYNQGDENPFVKCPYGTIGDRLWVREAFAESKGLITPTKLFKKTFYRADFVKDDSGERDGWWYQDKFINGNIKWKPSIHMPRCASRITLKITNIRVERLQEITEDDAIAEGVEQMAVPKPQRIWWKNYDPLANKTMAVPSVFTDPRQSFQSLWESINGKGSWEMNLWVWVIEFKRIA